MTFVGVLNADLSLNIPDFRASETNFSAYCVRFLGEVAEGHKQGHVIIQTYNPDHYAITCAAHT